VTYISSGSFEKQKEIIKKVHSLEDEVRISTMPGHILHLMNYLPIQNKLIEGRKFYKNSMK